MNSQDGALVAGLEVRTELLGSSDPMGTLVFIHGVGNGMHGWDRVVAALPEGWRVIRYSLRGHGRSKKPAGPYSLQDFVDDHNALMAEMQVGAYHLVGCSLGGLIAQGVALDRPRELERLVLISAVGGRTEAQQQAAMERLRALEEAGGPPGLASESGARWFTPEFARRHPDVVQERLDAYKKNHVPSYLASYRVLAENDLIDRLHEVQNETLVFTGEFDVGSPPSMSRNIGARIPRSTVRIIPGQKHQLLIEKPSLVAELVSRFAAGGPSALEGS